MTIVPPEQTATLDYLDDPQIHMSPAEVALLKTYYAKAVCYIEFGCGGSTFEALQFENIKSIHSIESDKAWVDKLKHYPMVADALQQKRLELIHVDIGPVKKWGAPAGPTHVTYWPDYYWGVWSQLPKNFDCLLIDGRFRVACTLMAALMCDPGHAYFLIHDFKGRSEYHILHKYFQEVAAADQLSVFLLRETASPRNLLQELHDYLFVPKDHVSQRQDICKSINDAFDQLYQQKQHHIALETQYNRDLEALRAQHSLDLEASQTQHTRALDHIKSQRLKEVDQLQKQVVHEKNLRAKLKRSFSWRITAPLRTVGRLLKNKK